MRVKSFIFLCVIILCLISIRLSIAIDDPEHLVIPNPDCPICQAYNSPVLIEFDVEVSSLSIILANLNEPSPSDLYYNSIIIKDSIRAPPIS